MHPPFTARCIRLADHLLRMSTMRGRDSLLHHLTQALGECLDIERCEIFGVVHEKAQRYWLPLTRQLRGQAVEFVSDTLRVDAEHLPPMASAPVRLACLDNGTAQSLHQGTQHAHLLPGVRLSGAHWGVVELCSTQPLGDDDLAAASRLVAMYGHMLDLLDYSECDALTGLWNRKPFDDFFYKTLPAAGFHSPTPAAEEHRHAYSHESFWLAMVDIDHFKAVNDTYGHQIGDEVLLLVARLLTGAFRASDRVYRFGGEEFVVVLRCPDHSAALATLERFRQAMESFAFPQAGRITASIGMTEIAHGDAPATACERADQAVYYAKHHGRNQVCSEGDLVRQGLLHAEAKVGDVELF